jgi:hypothetical protein
VSDGGFLANARLPRPALDERERRSAASRKGAAVRKRRAAMSDARDSEWGPEGPRRGSAPVGRIGSIAEILARLKGRST